MSIRYIPPIESDAARQMAIDEAILRNFDDGKTGTTFRFFRFKPSAITLGYTQSIDETIHEKRCKEENIPFVRRITGGGTVFHDYDGEITYSMVTEKSEEKIEKSFEKNLQPVINTLKSFGLDAKFKPYNDILVNNKKISGSAQRRGKEGMLQHGTLMYATDLEKLADILKVDKEKLEKKGAGSFLDLVTTIKREIGKSPNPEKLIEIMREKYTDHFEEDIVEKGLTEEEKRFASNLESKYSSSSWTYGRNWE